ALVCSAPGMMRTESNCPSPEPIHSFFLRVRMAFVCASHPVNCSASARHLLPGLICRLIAGRLPYNVHASQPLAQTRGFTRHHSLSPQNLLFGSSPNLNPLVLKMEFVCLFLNCPY